MGFGSSVSALLDTYSKCLSLLKAFQRNHDAAYDDEDRASLLRRSIRADRNQVRRAYSTRLSETGRRLEKGDSRAKSTLGRILKKLTAAIANLLRPSSFSSSAPALDYESLMSLSNVSRADAVHAIDQLSRRLSGASSSRRSLASSKTTRSSASSSARPHRRSSSTKSGSSSSSSNRGHQRKHSSSAAAASSSLTGPLPASAAAAKLAKRPSGRSLGGGAGNRHDGGTADAVLRKRTQDDPSPSKPRVPPSSERTTSGLPESTRGSSRRQSGVDSHSSRTAVEHRVSMASVSSSSTKLGEIPERKWRRQQQQQHYNPQSRQRRDGGRDSGSDGYGYVYEDYDVRPVYPLKPYRTEPVAKESGRFWNIFRR